MSVKEQDPVVTTSHRKLALRKGRIILICAVVLFAGFGCLCLWAINRLGYISQPWSGLLSSIFGQISLILTSLFTVISTVVIAWLSKDDLPQWLKHAIPVLKDQPDTALSTTNESGLTSSPPLEIDEHEKLLERNPDEIFLFNAPLPALDDFFGRTRERKTLLHRARSGLSTSIVGTRRIGKSWLMNYLLLAKEQNPTLYSNCRIGYLSASAPSCATLTSFTTKALEELGITLVTPARTKIGLESLESAVKDFNAKNITPVLCIDEFEYLCKHKEFNLTFLEHLRALTQMGLGLVTTSKRPLIDVVVEKVGEGGKTSPFFNVFEQLTLKPFTREEAEFFAEKKGQQAGFTAEERGYVLEYGKVDEMWFPLRLQLAGKMLLEDKNLAHTEGARYYRPQDVGYWRDFLARLEEKYQGVVRL